VLVFIARKGVLRLCQIKLNLRNNEKVKILKEKFNKALHDGLKRDILETTGIPKIGDVLEASRKK
jgi:hypothetical protein